eukprot:SAG31_NODE_373_length_16597_cov_21.519518_11_plen_98_part_00
MFVADQRLFVVSGNLFLKIVYLDIAGNSSWSAAFRGASSAMVTAIHVATTGTGRYLTAEATLPGAAFGPGMVSVDLVIRNEDEIDDVFAFVEIVKSK